MCIRVLYWYYLYINHPGVSRLAKTIQDVCYWKGLVAQVELHAKPCKMCQHFKKRNTIYGHLSPTYIVELKPWYTVHVDMIGPYSKSTIQQQTSGAIINNIVSLTCMNMINPATGWFEIVGVLTYELDEVTGGNDE